MVQVLAQIWCPSLLNSKKRERSQMCISACRQHALNLSSAANLGTSSGRGGTFFRRMMCSVCVCVVGRTEIQSESSCGDISWPAFRNPEEILSKIFCYEEEPGWFLPVTLSRLYRHLHFSYVNVCGALRVVACIIVSRKEAFGFRVNVQFCWERGCRGILETLESRFSSSPGKNFFDTEPWTTTNPRKVS